MFVISIPLNTDQRIQSVLKHRFNVYTHFYNAILRHGKKCVEKVWRLPEWVKSGEIGKKIKSGGKNKILEQERKELWKIIEEKSGLNERVVRSSNSILLSM